MLKNIFLFTGQEKYLLDNELKRRKDGFIEKYGKDSIFVFNSENFDAPRINESIRAGGLFFQKKLIIIYGIPLDTDVGNQLLISVTEKRAEEFIKKKGAIPEDVLLVFVSHKPDKRLKFYKFLSENASIKSFNNPKDDDYINFIKENLKNIESDTQTLKYLLFKVGQKFYRLSNEVEKINLYCQKNKISKLDNKTIDYIVFSDLDSNSFEFFDKFFEDKNKLLKLIDEKANDGTNRNEYAGMLYRGLKLYIFLVDFYQRGITDTKTIASAIKYHPFAVGKNIKNIKSIVKNYENIKTIYNNLIEIDSGIKTGKYPDSYFWLRIKKSIYDNL